MAVKILSIEELKTQRKKEVAVHKLTYRDQDGVFHAVENKIVDGEMNVPKFKKPLGQMLTTPAGLNALLKKMLIDVDFGREQVPLLYKPIYRTITDRNFPRNVDTQVFTQARVVFLRTLEGQEVQYGTRVSSTTQLVTLHEWAAAFRWSEDVVEYDETWSITQLDQALGEAYNALLNHIHLDPIISYAYANKNKTAADTTGADLFEKMRLTLRTALDDAAADLGSWTKRPRHPSILLANSRDRFLVEDQFVNQRINSTDFPAMTDFRTVIYWDGWTTTVGEKTYTYPGVPQGTIFAIDPQRYFVELIKHDLIVDATGAKLHNLTAGGLVGRARRGLLAVPADAVQQITLPT